MPTTRGQFNDSTLICILGFSSTHKRDALGYGFLGRLEYRQKCLISLINSTRVRVFCCVSIANTIHGQGLWRVLPRISLNQVMARCHPTTHIYLNQYWAGSMIPYSVTWPQRAFNYVLRFLPSYGFMGIFQSPEYHNESGLSWTFVMQRTRYMPRPTFIAIG